MKLSKREFEALVANAQRMTVPYHQLGLSPDYQARSREGDPPMNLMELAASIKALGLLQNLLVTPGRRGRYEVCGGGRRWQAMGCLVEAGDWPENYPVPVLVVAREQALLVSLSENRHQQPMHPADEFAAFATLIERGRSVEEVAACFGVTPLVVTRRMKLAQVSPVLMTLYRDDEIGLDQLMVLASVDDHQRQEQVWEALPDWNRRPDCLRALLAQDEIASSDPRVRFVTLEAYEQAGGAVRRDLFSDEGTVYLQDQMLLERLAHERLALTAAELSDDGWSWVETQVRFDYSRYSKHGRVRAQQRECSRDDVQQGAEEPALEVWAGEVKACAGCVVSLGADATVEIRYGLLRPGTLPVSVGGTPYAESVAVSDLEDAPVAVEPPARAVHSKEFMRVLSAHRVAAVQAELLQRPEVALAVLTTHLTQQVFARHDGRCSRPDQPLAIQLSDSFYAVSTALNGSEYRPALEAVEAAYAQWLTVLPEDLSWAGLLPWLMSQPQSQTLQLLAFVVARAVTGIDSVEPLAPWTNVLPRALDLDMHRWWRATADAYFKHVSKQRIVEVVAEVVDAQSACSLEGMKKALCALRAEQLIDGHAWLPECMRRAETGVAEADAVEAR